VTAICPPKGDRFETPRTSRLPAKEYLTMRSTFAVCVVLSLALAAFGQPKAYQTGKVMQMDSVQCGTSEKDGKSKKTSEVLCQEYVLQADNVVYHIRPVDAKHPVLLPVGNQAEFRMEKDKMMLKLEDGKERQYVVVSMTPRTDASTAQAAPYRLNHVQ
jgi:hypothetical protein